jgi:hypothetical protein
MTNSQGTAKPAPAIDQQRVEAEISWVGARLREPSTYAGLSSLAAAAALFHLIPSGDGAALVKYVTMIGMGVGGLIAILLPEKGSAKLKAANTTSAGPNISSAAVLILAVALAALLSATSAMAQPKLKLPIPLPAPRPAVTAPVPLPADPLADFMTQLENVKAETLSAVIADVQAADADASILVTPAIPADPTATPPTPAIAAVVRDPISHACYPALVQFLQSTPTFQPPTGKLVGVQLFQRKRDFVAQLKAGLPTYLKLGCAPLLGDEVTSFISIMAMVGVKVLPAGIAAICPPCAAAVAPIALPALTLTP